VLDARSVVPVQGHVMVFPHGGTKGSLVHEGSAVVKVRGMSLVHKYPQQCSVRGVLADGRKEAVQWSKPRSVYAHLSRSRCC
jgi:hypothetical protein